LDFDLSLTGFDDREIDDFLSDPGDDGRANIVPEVPPAELAMCFLDALSLWPYLPTSGQAHSACGCFIDIY
jgi:hypothetical protein